MFWIVCSLLQPGWLAAGGSRPAASAQGSHADSATTSHLPGMRQWPLPAPRAMWAVPPAVSQVHVVGQQEGSTPPHTTTCLEAHLIYRGFIRVEAAALVGRCASKPALRLL